MFLSLFTGDLQPGLKMFPLHVKITVTRFGLSIEVFQGVLASCWNFALSLPFPKHDALQKQLLTLRKTMDFAL
jgi:hypothetical protein